MVCHDRHAPGACSAVFSGIRLSSPRPSPRPPRLLRLSVYGPSFPHPVSFPFVPVFVLPVRLRRDPNSRVPPVRARAGPRALRGGARFARPIARARDRRRACASRRFQWVFLAPGAGAEGEPASGRRFLLSHSSTDSSRASISGNYYRHFIERHAGSDRAAGTRH